jgi:hypothetical protein
MILILSLLCPIKLKLNYLEPIEGSNIMQEQEHVNGPRPTPAASYISWEEKMGEICIRNKGSREEKQNMVRGL